MENKNIDRRFEQLENILKWYGLDVDEFMHMGEEEIDNAICTKFKHINTRDYLYLLTNDNPAFEYQERSVVQVPVYPNKHFKRGEFLDKATNLKEIKSTPNGNVHILRP